MSGRRVLALATRIVRQFRRDRRTLALLFVAPVLILSLLGWIYRGSSDEIGLAVVVPEPSPLAGQIVQALEDDPALRVVELSAEEAARRLEEREIDGVLTLPPNPRLHPGGPPPEIEIAVEGTDPGRAGAILGAVSRALPQAVMRSVSPEGLSPRLEPRFLHGGPEFDQLDYLAPTFIGFFAFFFVFLLTSVSFLRERMQGSIERLLVSPLSRAEIVLGYMLGFTLFAALQSVVLVLFSVYVLRINYAGSLWLVFFFTLLLTLGAVNLGIFLSTFARTELQVVQFIPLVVTPQGLLSGIIWNIATLPEPLRWLAHLMPLTYANAALRDVMIAGRGLTDLWLPTLALAGFAALMILLGATTLRREVV